MEQNIKPIKINELIQDESKDRKKSPNNIFIRLDSPDNESNTIIFKYTNLRPESEPESETNKPKNITEKKSAISHDKEIMEDSIIYFTQKLKNNNMEYQRYLYVSIGLYFLDIGICYFYKQILNTKYNLYSILIILFVSLLQAFAFKHNFNSISKERYVLTQRIIYLYCIALIIFLLNIVYIIVFKLVLNPEENNYNAFQKKSVNFFGISLMIFTYIIVNIVIPIIVLVKLITIKKNIKSLSAAKGEVYEAVKIKDSHINSIIN